jgi:hypothetical protein
MKNHETYNKKAFLAPDSILSMAAIHTKIKKDGECSVRISDCKNSIKLWNDLNDNSQVLEILQKLDSLIENLDKIKKEIKSRYE